jgi:hypothetical protein
MGESLISLELALSPDSVPRATAFTFYKALRVLALYLLHKYFYVVAKTGHIKGSRVNAVALKRNEFAMLKVHLEFAPGAETRPLVGVAADVCQNIVCHS